MPIWAMELETKSLRNKLNPQTAGRRSGGSVSQDSASAAPGYDSRLLRPQVGEDLIGGIDAKDAGSRSSVDNFEDTRNLDKGRAAGVKTPDILGCVDDPDAVPASGDLSGISALAEKRLARGVIAKDIIGDVDSPNVIHSDADLRQEALNAGKRLRGKVEVEDVALTIQSPHVASAGCDLSQETRDCRKLASAVVVPENGAGRVDAPGFIGMAIVLVADADHDL